MAEGTIRVVIDTTALEAAIRRLEELEPLLEKVANAAERGFRESDRPAPERTGHLR
jgi:hypothetical protein